MGQYHYTVNLDKRECLCPHGLGDGLKLLEQSRTCEALTMLLACSSGRGGGDYQSENYHPDRAPEAIIGRWAGDRIAVVGDYAEAGDLAPEHEAGGIYGHCCDGGYADITAAVRAVFEVEHELVFCGSGWLDVVRLWDIEGLQYTARGSTGRYAEFEGRQVAPVSEVQAAIRRAHASKRRDAPWTLALLRNFGLVTKARGQA